jgi:hypothetical protein
MRMWDEETDEGERNAIDADIRDLTVDCSRKDLLKAAYIRFDDLDAISKNVRWFKDILRLRVDQAGGSAGWPSSLASLSRLFPGSSARLRCHAGRRCSKSPAPWGQARSRSLPCGPVK